MLIVVFFPQASEKQPWLQISFSDMERKITKITTWGGGKGLGYVKVYRLAFTEVGDNRVWSDYKEGDKTRVSSIIFFIPSHF